MTEDPTRSGGADPIEAEVQRVSAGDAADARAFTPESYAALRGEYAMLLAENDALRFHVNSAHAVEGRLTAERDAALARAITAEKRVAEAEDDVLRIHNEKVDFFEKTIMQDLRIAEMEAGVLWMTTLYSLQMRYVSEANKVTEITACGEERTTESIIAKARALLAQKDAPHA